MSAPFRLEALGEHNRVGFDCGQSDLNRYFQTQITQDIRRHVTNCFVAVESAQGFIAGYYTLSAASISMTDLPQDLAKRLPRYPSLPAVRIGRLAVDKHFQGQGLGGAMLGDAVARCLQAAPASYTLLVDAKDDHSVTFYQHYGFRSFESRRTTLFLPLATAAKIFGP